MEFETNNASSTPATSASASPSPSIKESAPVSRVFQAGVDQKLPEVISGNGTRFTIKDPYTGKTKELLDGMTGAAVGSLGWGDSDVVEYINEAAKACTYQYSSNIGNKYAEELAKFYIDQCPEGAFASAIWTTSGSEANETALRTIRQYWLELGKPQKIKNLSRYTSYHGFTTGTLSIGDSNRAAPFKDILLPSTQCVKLPEYLPFHYKKAGESDEDYSLRLLKEYEEIILKEDPDTIASLSVETISATSCTTSCPTKSYIYGLRKLCDKYDILFHLDEVMCGTGRINPNGGLCTWENFLPPDEGPDLQAVGKTLGSGYVTIAGLLVSPKVKNVFVNGSNFINGSFTYSSHAFNCYVALKIQQKVISQGLPKNIFELGNYLGAQLKEKLADSKMVSDVRGLGGFWTVEFLQNKQEKVPFDRMLGVSTLVKKACQENGLNLLGAQDNIRGVGGDFIMFAPAFVVTKQDMDEMVAITCKSVAEVEAQLLAEGVLN